MLSRRAWCMGAWPVLGGILCSTLTNSEWHKEDECVNNLARQQQQLFASTTTRGVRGLLAVGVSVCGHAACELTCLLRLATPGALCPVVRRALSRFCSSLPRLGTSPLFLCFIVPGALLPKVHIHTQKGGSEVAVLPWDHLARFAALQ